MTGANDERESPLRSWSNRDPEPPSAAAANRSPIGTQVGSRPTNWVVLGDELLGELSVFTEAKRRDSQAKYGPAWSVAFWWHEVRDELDLTGFSADDYDVLLGRLAPSLPDWALRSPPSPATTDDRGNRRKCAARIYLAVDGAFSPVCMNFQDARDLAWMRGPSVAIGEAPDTGWPWKMTGGFSPTPLPIELAQQPPRSTRQPSRLSGSRRGTRWRTRCSTTSASPLGSGGTRPSTTPPSIDKWQFVVTELERDPLPFVWIDDQQITPSTWCWAATCGVPNLLVHTNRYHGVTPTTWSTALAWLHEHTRVDPSGLGGALPELRRDE